MHPRHALSPLPRLTFAALLTATAFGCGDDGDTASSSTTSTNASSTTTGTDTDEPTSTTATTTTSATGTGVSDSDASSTTDASTTDASTSSSSTTDTTTGTTDDSTTSTTDATTDTTTSTTGSTTDTSSSTTATGTSTTGSTTDTSTSTTTTTGEPVDCQAGPVTKRYGKIPPMLVTTDAYTNDGGLQAVFDAMPTMSGGVVTLDPPLPVTDVTITITGFFSQTDVWVQDANQAVRLFLYDGPMATPEIFPVANPGIKVSFDVTELTNFFGEYEITGITNIQVVPAQDQPVRVRDAAAEGIVFDYERDHDQVFHMYGEIADSGVACGSSGSVDYTCYTFLYGGDKTVELRTGNFEVTGEVGQCIQFTAPLGAFQGEPQFFIRDFDWLTDQY